MRGRFAAMLVLGMLAFGATTLHAQSGGGGGGGWVDYTNWEDCAWCFLACQFFGNCEQCPCG